MTQQNKGIDNWGQLGTIGDNWDLKSTISRIQWDIYISAFAVWQSNMASWQIFEYGGLNRNISMNAGIFPCHA